MHSPSAAARALGVLTIAAERSAADPVALLGVVEVLSKVLDERDASDAWHSRCVSRLCREIALEMGCGEHDARTIEIAGRLHDIGKLIIPDEILEKPGRLTASEWRLMRLHPGVGAEIVGRIGIFRPMMPAIRGHHERFDGMGYPDGIAGHAIPLGARIIAAADAYSAITSDRPYRQRRSAQEADLELRRCAGPHFDPAVVDALVRVIPQAHHDLRAA